MSVKEYYHVFEAILLSLIVTKLFIGWNRMLKERKTINIYWLHILLSIIIFLTVCSRYHNQLTMIHIEHVTNGISFMFHVIAIPAALYFASDQIFPREIRNTDFRTFIEENKPFVFYPIIAYLLINGIQNIFFEETDWKLSYMNLVFLFIPIPLIHSKKLLPLEVLTVIATFYLIYLMIIY